MTRWEPEKLEQSKQRAEEHLLRWQKARSIGREDNARLSTGSKFLKLEANGNGEDTMTNPGKYPIECPVCGGLCRLYAAVHEWFCPKCGWDEQVIVHNPTEEDVEEDD